MKGGMGSSNMASFVNQSVRKSWDPCLTRFLLDGIQGLTCVASRGTSGRWGNPDLPSKPNCGSAPVVSYDIVADVAVPKFDIRWKSVKMREKLVDCECGPLYIPLS